METIRTMTVPADLTTRAGGGVAAATDQTPTAYDMSEHMSDIDTLADKKNEDLSRIDAEFSMDMSAFSPNVDDFISTERFGSPEVHRSVSTGSSSRSRKPRTKGLVKAPSVRAAVAAKPESLHLGSGSRRASWYGELPSLGESPTKKRRYDGPLEDTEEVTRGIGKRSSDAFSDDDEEDDLDIVNVPAAKRTCYAPILRCSERPTIPANIKSLSLIC